MLNFMRTVILLLTFLIASPSLKAQVKKTFYNSFELSDSIKVLNINFGPEASVKSWVGSAILIETQVRIENGNNSLFKVLKEAGRYDLKEERIDSLLSLSPMLKERPIIQNSQGEIQETVSLKVLLPDSFVSADSTLWKKKEE